MFKKLMSTLLVVAITAGIAIGGTVAYLTDRDSKANVFTVGNVSVRLDETFVEENANLVPGKDIKKEVKVTNTGANDAWVWYTYAIPKALDTANDASKNVLHVNHAGANWLGYQNNSSYWADGQTVATPENQCWIVDYNPAGNGAPVGSYTDDKGVVYNVYAVLYNGKLASGDTTTVGMTKVYMDTKVDIDVDGKWYFVENGTATALDWDSTKTGPVIYVTAYAIQTDGFNTVQDAYAAYQTQWGENGFEYGDNDSEDVYVPVGGDVVEVTGGTDKAAVLTAINAAEPGDIVRLTEDATIAGYAATEKLVIDKDITLDLNGKTLTTECGWGGIDLKGGASIVNGTINHTGNTAAIKAFQVEKIENVTINVTQTAGKTKGGIVVQEGAGCYVGSIKNVTITGATNGIETYRCGDRTDLAIGSMENVKIDAVDTGIQLSAPVGKIINSSIKGGNIGINVYLYGPYSVSAELVNSVVSGSTGIYAHDEVGKTNPGSLTIVGDSFSTINGGITQEFEAEVAGRVTVEF